MAKKSLVRWMAKNDSEAYGFWKKYLAPSLGRSVKKTKEMISILKICSGSPFYGFSCKNESVKKISREMKRYQSINGASITFGFLYNLARDHKRKILRWRSE